MDADQWLLWSAAELPFPSSRGDWFICIVPEYERVVFIEHSLIVEVAIEVGIPRVVRDPPAVPGPDGMRWMVNAGEEYSEVANTIGHTIAKWLSSQPVPERDGGAWAIRATKVETPMWVGFYCGGRVFVFRPRAGMAGEPSGADGKGAG